MRSVLFVLAGNGLWNEQGDHLGSGAKKKYKQISNWKILGRKMFVVRTSTMARCMNLGRQPFSFRFWFLFYVLYLPGVRFTHYTYRKRLFEFCISLAFSAEGIVFGLGLYIATKESSIVREASANLEKHFAP